MKSINVKYTQGKDVDLIHKDNFKADPATWAEVYNIRNHRQQIALQSMLASFNGLGMKDRLGIIESFPRLAETNLDKDFLFYISKSLLVKPTISYTTLPGYYSSEADKLFYYPDVPSFDLLRKQAIRNTIRSLSNREQVIY